MSLGQQRKPDQVDIDADSLTELYAIPVSKRKWGMQVDVYIGISSATYCLIYNRVDTNIANNSNWLRIGKGHVKIENADNVLRKVEEVLIGTWDMDTTTTKTVDLSSVLSIKIQNVFSFSIKINDDSLPAKEYFLPYVDPASGVVQGSFDWNDQTKILTLWRLTGGFFDNSSFNRTSFFGNDWNRGFVVVGWVD
jgi:hypothetical protein